MRQLAGDLDWICMRALEKEPARRYATVDALALDVRRHLDGEPVSAAPPSAGYRVRKLARRNRIAVTAGAAVAVMLVLGAAGLVSALAEGARADAAATVAGAARMSAKAVSEFANRTFMSGDAWNEGGVTGMTVLDAMNNAIRDLDEGRFADDPEIEASLQDTIATILMNNGRLEEAEALLVQAVGTRRELYPGDHPDVAWSLCKLATV